MSTAVNGAVVEFFFSFRSPYSYLAAERVFALADRWQLQVRYRGVAPMVSRGIALPRAKQLYILRDAAREARRLGIPFGPLHDPLGAGARNCLGIAELASASGRAREFVTVSSRAIWSQAADVSKPRVLRRLCAAAGLDWMQCQQALADPQWLRRCERNAQRLRAAGHWGVPTMIFAGEVFWGQDRIVDLEARLREGGVPCHAASEPPAREF